MKKNKKMNPDMPQGKLTEVTDFLPPPSQIIFPTTKERVTMELTASTVQFFKAQARKHHTKYQTMIRHLLDRYATHFKA